MSESPTDDQTRPARIALIHALEESIAPARAAFAEVWPQAVRYDLLDTSLSRDLASGGDFDKAITDRIRFLSDYAAGTKGEGGKTVGLLFTCSAFGPAIDAARKHLSIPVLKPNEAAFEAALALGSRIGLIVSFAPSAVALELELSDLARQRKQRTKVHVILAERALEALAAGDTARHDRIVADAAARLPAVDAIILGQFSLARARDLAQSAASCPVITTPHFAVRELKRRVLAGN